MNIPYDLSALALLGIGASWLYDRPHAIWHAKRRVGCPGCVVRSERRWQRRIDEATRELRKRRTR